MDPEKVGVRRIGVRFMDDGVLQLDVFEFGFSAMSRN